MAPRRGALVTAAIVLVSLFQFARFLSGSPVPASENGPPHIHSRGLFSTASRETTSHPIATLMMNAEATYRDLARRQSRTLDAAVAAYRRKYKRDPPKGFDEWFAFAQENDVKIIDEYDSMVADLAPFWGLPGEEVRRRALQVGQLPSIDLVRLENGKAVMFNTKNGFNDTEVSARAKGFRVMIEKFQHKLSDMDFPINAKAEGRILVPWEHIMYPNLSKADSSAGIESMIGSRFSPDWRGDGNVWEEYRRTCNPSSQARRLFGSVRGQPSLTNAQRPLSYIQRHDAENTQSLVAPQQPDQDFAFAARPDDAYDFCQHPWAHYQQGHFFSDWRTIPVLYPVFSPAKTMGYSDILIPSHYYYSSTKKYTYGWDPKKMVVNDIDENEVPWDRKTDKIFWRGATTGGGSTPSGFIASYQRHRFIEMAAEERNGTRSVVFADPPGSDRFKTADVPLEKMNAEFMDAAFTKAVGCQGFKGGCDDMMRHYRFADAVPLGENWRHKYLVDVDGMGYSARLMALLASDSAVVKATVYREFFSDWIQPWLHYIPLSQSYNEIYNIHAYFSGASRSMLQAANSSAVLAPNPRRPYSRVDVEGDKQLRHIAREGRQWQRSVARKVDMEAYVYRLCLEYARLWSDDRDKMSYGS